MNHVIATLLMQAVIGFTTGNWWAGAASGSFFYLGREIAQAEYRNIYSNYGRKRANMPWWGGFEKRAWDIKSILDWVLPSIVSIIVAIIVPIFN